MSQLLKQAKILLVCTQTSLRTSLRKALCDMGADNKLIEIASDMQQVKSRLSKDPINILITDSDIGDKEKGLDLIELFEKNNPVSKNRIFILMTGQSTPFLMADFVLKGGDCILNKPFTNDTFIKTIKALINEKENRPIEDTLVLDIQDVLKAKDLAKAISILRDFKDQSCSQALYSQAIVSEFENNLVHAYELYMQALESKANFRVLVNVLRIGVFSKKHSELLKYVEVWLKDFPIHHSSLQDMARVIISNRKFTLLDELFQIFSQHKIDDQFAKIPLAAGYVLAATHHLESSQNDKAKSYALKGIEYSCGRQLIMYKAIEVLIKVGAKAEAEKIYMASNFDTTTLENKISDLKLRSLVLPENKVLLDCNKLLAEKVVNADLYQIIITCMRRIGKDPQDVISIALRNFPGQNFN